MTKVRLIVRSVSMPSRAAILRSCSVARMARPRGVRVTRKVKTATQRRVVRMMTICITESSTVKPPL